MASSSSVSISSLDGITSAEDGVPIGGVRVVDNFPGFGSNPNLLLTWDAIASASDMSRLQCVPNFGSGHSERIEPIPYIPPEWWKDLPPMPAPRGVKPAKWAKLGLKAQYQLWALGKAIATPNLNPGLSASIGCAAADIGTLLANEEIGNEVARLTNKLIGDLEAGEQVGSAFLVLNSGSVQSYAASLAYAGCQFYNELRYNLPFLSQNAFDAAKKMVQGLAEGSTDFPTTLQQFNLTEWGLFGVRAAYAQSYGETCQSKVFGNRTASDFDMREEDLFGPAARSGGGPSGRVPYVPPPPWLFTDAFGDCIGAEPERARREL